MWITSSDGTDTATGTGEWFTGAVHADAVAWGEHVTGEEYSAR